MDSKLGKNSSGNKDTNLCQYTHYKELSRIVEAGGQLPLINPLYRTMVARSSADLLIDYTESAVAEFLAIVPIFLHHPMSIVPFLHICFVSNATLKDFCFEFIPLN